MKTFDSWVNHAEAVEYLESGTKDGDLYTLVANGKTLNILERFEGGNREVLLWSKAEPTKLYKIVGSGVEKILPRLVVQHFTGLTNVEFTDGDNHKHFFEDVGIFPVSIHNGMVRFSDAAGRKWICSDSDVPNVTLAFYKLLYDGRTDMSALMLPRLTRRDDVQVLRSGVGGKKVPVWEEPKFDDIAFPDLVASSVDDLARSIPNLDDHLLFPHQGDVPEYGVAVVSGMAVSSADREFIASAERKVKGFIGSGSLGMGTVSPGGKYNPSDEAADRLGIKKQVSPFRREWGDCTVCGKPRDGESGLYCEDCYKERYGHSSITDPNTDKFYSSSLKRPVRSEVTFDTDNTGQYPQGYIPPTTSSDATDVNWTEEENKNLSEAELNIPSSKSTVQSAGFLPGIEGIHDQYVNGHIGDDEAAQMILVICPECTDPMSFISDWGSELNVTSKLRRLVNSASQFRLQLYDNGVFHLDLGKEKDGAALFSAVKGVCDSGSLISIAGKDGYDFNNLFAGVDLSQSYVLSEIKKYITSLAQLEAVKQEPVKRSIETWVISGKELDAELKKWGLNNPGRVFQSINVLGVSLDGSIEFPKTKTVQSGGKVPVKSTMEYDPVEAWVNAMLDEAGSDTVSLTDNIGNIQNASPLEYVNSYGLEGDEAEEFVRLWPEIQAGLLEALSGRYKSAFRKSIGLPQSKPGARLGFKKPLAASGKGRSVTSGLYTDTGSDELARLDYLYDRLERAEMRGDEARIAALQKEIEALEKVVKCSFIQSDFKGLVQMVKGWLQRVHEGLMESNTFYQNLMRLLRGNGYPGNKANTIYEELMAGKPVEAVMASYHPVKSGNYGSGFLSPIDIVRDKYFKGEFDRSGAEEAVLSIWPECPNAASLVEDWDREIPRGVGASLKRSVKSGWQGGDPMSELLDLIGEYHAWKLHDAYMKDGGDNPTLVADEIYRLTGEPAGDPFVEALEAQWYEELEGSMGPPRPSGNSSGGSLGFKMPAAGDGGRLTNSYKCLHSGEGSYILSVGGTRSFVEALHKSLIKDHPDKKWDFVSSDLMSNGYYRVEFRYLYKSEMHWYAGIPFKRVVYWVNSIGDKNE